MSDGGIQIWNALDGRCIARIANEGFTLRPSKKSMPVCNAQCTRVASLAPNNTIKLLGMLLMVHVLIPCPQKRIE